MLAAWEDPLATMQQLAQQYGPLVRVRFGTRVHHLATRPEQIRHVLVDHASRYGKGRTFEKTRGYLGDGLATSAGEKWRRQRRLMQPHFHREAMARLGPLVCDAIAETARRWDRRARGGELFDAWQDLMAMALSVTTRALFGAQLRTGEEAVIVEAFETALEHTTRRVLLPVDLPNWLPTPGALRFRAAIGRLDRIVHRIIDEESDAPTLLGALVAARDEAGAGMTAPELRDEVMTLMLGGHETTGNTLAWAMDLLSRHPAVENELRAELRGLEDRPPAWSDLERLPFTSAVVSETMRLYPQNWVMARDATEEDRIGGFVIPAGTTVFLGVYVCHHDPTIWPDPERFDPGRFLRTGEPRDAFAYVPFGAGQRKCIGAPFAMAEATLALATLLQRFRVCVARPGPTRPVPSFALRPHEGLPVVLRPVPVGGGPS
jgi:cytochrome P450